MKDTFPYFKMIKHVCPDSVRIPKNDRETRRRRIIGFAQRHVLVTICIAVEVVLSIMFLNYPSPEKGLANGYHVIDQ